MNPILKNLEDLFSEDKKIVYQALNNKRDDILHSFYLLLNNDEETLNLLKDGYLPFTKLFINPSLVNKEIYNQVFDAFNNNFRVCYFYKNLDVSYLASDQIIVKVNFKDLDKASYLVTFPNFYQTLPAKEITLNNNLTTIDLIKLALDDNLGDYVLIMDASLTKNNRFYLPFCEEVYFPADFDEKVIEEFTSSVKGRRINAKRIHSDK